MKYTPRQRKLVLELLEDRNAPGVLFDVAPPFAPDAAVPKSSISLSEIPSSIDSLRDISITGLDSFANVPARLQCVGQQRTEPRRVDTVSPLSFSLAELNDVFKSNFYFTLPSQRSDKAHTLGMGNISSVIGHTFEKLSELQKEPASQNDNAQDFQAYVVLRNSDALYSILTVSSLKSDTMADEPATNWVHLDNGNIRIDCTTTPETWLNDEGILGNNAKLNPGWFSNVNWSDDDNDGWSPETTKTITAGQSAIYTPDKGDDFIENGDPDLRKFKVYVSAHNNLAFTTGRSS